MTGCWGAFAFEGFEGHAFIEAVMLFILLILGSLKQCKGRTEQPVAPRVMHCTLSSAGSSLRLPLRRP